MYNFVYEYIRNKNTNKYDIENVVTEIDNNIIVSPSCEICVAIPNKKFIILGEDILLKCEFEEELNVDERNILDSIISNSRQL